MGQWEVHGFLKENPGKWFTTRQLSEHLGVSAGSIGSSIRKLRKTGLVAFKTIKLTTPRMTSSKDIYAYKFKKE